MGPARGRRRRDRVGREPVRAVDRLLPAARRVDHCHRDHVRPVRGGADPGTARRRPLVRPGGPAAGGAHGTCVVAGGDRDADRGRLRARTAVRRASRGRDQQRAGVRHRCGVDPGGLVGRPGPKRRRATGDDRDDHGFRGRAAGRGAGRAVGAGPAGVGVRAQPSAVRSRAGTAGGPGSGGARPARGRDGARGCLRCGTPDGAAAPGPGLAGVRALGVRDGRGRAGLPAGPGHGGIAPARVRRGRDRAARVRRGARATADRPRCRRPAGVRAPAAVDGRRRRRAGEFGLGRGGVDDRRGPGRRGAAGRGVRRHPARGARRHPAGRAGRPSRCGDVGLPGAVVPGLRRAVPVVARAHRSGLVADGRARRRHGLAVVSTVVLSVGRRR